MLRRSTAAVLAALVLCGWAGPAGASPKSHITADGSVRMKAAKGVMAQWRTARAICIDQGLAPGTDPFVRCFTEYRLLGLRALQSRAKALNDAVARKHGLCIDRKRFEIAPCKEI